MQFTYDLFNFNTGSFPDRAGGWRGFPGPDPNQITKINIKHMSFASTLHALRGIRGWTCRLRGQRTRSDFQEQLSVDQWSVVSRIALQDETIIGDTNEEFLNND